MGVHKEFLPELKQDFARTSEASRKICKRLGIPLCGGGGCPPPEVAAFDDAR